MRSIEQKGKFSARGAAHLLLPVAITVIVALGGFFAVRWAISSEAPSGQSGSSSTRVGLRSLSDAVSSSSYVVLVRVADEDPIERTIGSGRYTALQEDVQVEVVQYLKGAGERTLTVTQSVEYTTITADERQIVSEADGSTSLVRGKTYLLFLRDGTPGHWIPVGEPVGFEVDGQSLIATGRISPADWGLSGLDDLIEQVAALDSSNIAQDSITP